MKIRNSFVSNSSSSSFIISHKPKASKKVQITIEIDLNNLSSETITNEQALDRFVEYHDYSKATRNSLAEELAKGNVISKIRVSSEDYGIESALYEIIGGDPSAEYLQELFQKSEGIKVISPTYEYDED